MPTRDAITDVCDIATDQMITTFNPCHAAASYLLLSEPDACDSDIFEAKVLLQEQINLIIPVALQHQVTWEVNPEHQQYDPETDTYVTCTSVAWRYTP